MNEHFDYGKALRGNTGGAGMSKMKPTASKPSVAVSMEIELDGADILAAVRRKMGENFALAHEGVKVLRVRDNSPNPYLGQVGDPASVNVYLSIPVKAVA